MLTPFGKAIRKLRIDKNLTLYDLAFGIDKSPSYMSSIETGKRELSSEIFEQIVNFFKIPKSSSLYHELVNCADQSKTYVRIDFPKNVTSEAKETAMSFARHLPNMTAQQIEKLNKILKGE